MKRTYLSGKFADSPSALLQHKRGNNGDGFTYFRHDTGAIKLLAWVVLRAEYVLVAAMRTVSHLAALYFTVFVSSYFSPDALQTVARFLPA